LAEIVMLKKKNTFSASPQPLATIVLSSGCLSLLG
jgi:hypothetical protein